MVGLVGRDQKGAILTSAACPWRFARRAHSDGRPARAWYKTTGV